MHHHLFSYQIQPWNDVDTFAIGLHITRVASLAPGYRIGKAWTLPQDMDKVCQACAFIGAISPI